MKFNKTMWAALLAFLYVGIMGAGSCGKNASMQIDSAKVAIEDARKADAEEYVPVEFKSAEDSLIEAQDLFDKYKYKKSLEEGRVAETKAVLAETLANKEKKRIADLEEAERLALMKKHQDSLMNENTLTDKEIAERDLKNVYFALDSYVLSDQTKQTLIENAQLLLKYKSLNIKVEGHCDDRGTEEYNNALGANRARTVYEFIVSQGVSPNRMSTISYGENLPIDKGQNEEAWAKNRRAQFAVVE